MFTPLPVTYQYVFAMVRELEPKFMANLEENTARVFDELKTVYADPVIDRDGLVLWQCNMINNLDYEPIIDCKMIEALPKGSWGSVTLPYFVTRESVLTYKFRGALKFFPFPHKLMYCLNVENYADDPVDAPEVDPDGEYASIGLSVSRKGAEIVARTMPHILKDALEPFCCFHEKFEEGEFKDEEAWLYGNVPWCTIASDFEEFVKSNLEERYVTFIKIPQKKPLESSPDNFFEACNSEDRFPVLYGTYGPFHRQKDHFLLAMFQQFNFS